MYPLFHFSFGDNTPRPSANSLECHLFTGEPREGGIVTKHTFYEFFAGGGMARAGLSSRKGKYGLPRKLGD
jgi:hypothetical protein